MAESLWGAIAEPALVQSPLFIIREQAGILTTATNGELFGQVIAVGTHQCVAAYGLDIVVPALENYTYSVAQLEFPPAHFYPATLRDSTRQTVHEVKDEQAFRAALREVLGSAQLRQVISKLRNAASAA
jgi:hypothetical protein